MKKIFLALFTLSLPGLSFAILCPTNFNQVSLGDTIDAVTKQCGAPAKSITKTVKKEGAQEWNYYIPQTVSNVNMSQTQGTLKTQFAFDKEGKAVNISVNGIGVGSTLLCGRMVQLGATRDQVKQACGDPTFINKQQESATPNPEDETKVTEMLFNSTPPVTFVFTNGVLTERK